MQTLTRMTAPAWSVWPILARLASCMARGKHCASISCLSCSTPVSGEPLPCPYALYVFLMRTAKGCNATLQCHPMHSLRCVDVVKELWVC